jgi:hypothetical protein
MQACEANHPVIRILNIVVLLLLLATGASTGAQDGVCHASPLLSVSDDRTYAPITTKDHASVQDFRSAASHAATGHCLSEVVTTSAELVFLAPVQQSFEQMALPHGQGLLVPPEPQPPRL